MDISIIQYLLAANVGERHLDRSWKDEIASRVDSLPLCILTIGVGNFALLPMARALKN
jgi:hypothetical protein